MSLSPQNKALIDSLDLLPLLGGKSAGLSIGELDRALNAARSEAHQAAEAQVAGMRERLHALRVTASLLLGNAEGCAVHHHGLDFAEQGLPGWLADCRAEIDKARSALASIGKEGGQ